MAKQTIQTNTAELSGNNKSRGTTPNRKHKPEYLLLKEHSLSLNEL